MRPVIEEDKVSGEEKRGDKRRELRRDEKLYKRNKSNTTKNERINI